MTSGYEKESSETLAQNRYIFPLSFAQQRLWYLQQLDPASTAYNMHWAYRLRGSLNVAALEQGLNSLVRRHEILRTTFPLHNGEPVQRVHPALAVSLSMTSLLLEEQGREEMVQRLLHEDARRSFELDRGPLIRAGLIRTRVNEHVFHLSMHHIVSDEWSMRILLRELAFYYAAHSQDTDTSLAELPIQYADYSVWQRDWLQGDNLEIELSYWRQQLDGVSPVDLPTDRPRPSVQTYFGAERAISISPQVCHQLKSLSRREGVTFFMTLLAAFQMFLHRYTGQADISVGTPIAGRTRQETEGLIGFFVNTLVLRADVTGNPTVKEFLHRVRRVALDAYEHQDLPFERLVQELNPKRDLSRNPVFQIMFALRNAPDSDLVLPNLRASHLAISTEVAKFDLSASVTDSSDSFAVTFNYNTDLFEAPTIERMLGHFRTLLEGIVANPEQRISELPLLAELERDKLLVEWNDTETDYLKDKCIHELFETQVEKTPDAIAVVFEDQQFTYRELNTRANQLAHHLRKRGVRPESLIAVCMERSLEMVIGILGVVKAGGAYVPIDPDTPTDRLKFMLQDAQAALILTQERFSSLLAEFTDQRVCLDSAGVDLSLENKENPENLVDGKNAAYMIYTSGSTGTPKGVLNVHGGLRNRLQWMQDAYGLKPADRVLQKTPFTFDVSVWEFFWPLISGAGLVIARPGGHRDSAYLVQLINSQQITTLHFVPSMLGMFLQEEGVESCATLRQVICSGEALSHELQQRFFERTGVALSNLYGPTEASIDVTAWECRSDSDRTIVPIGRPIANTQVYILDGDLNPLPIGVVGEIYIGGDGVARGYLNRPELTAEKFIPDPFSNEPGARIYKTGDLARYLPDGNIDFLGRTDHQVKIRGYRIELGEIEAVLAQHPTIKESVVLAREDTAGDQRLVAYVVGAGGSQPSAHDLRRFLQQKLPEYMVPSAFIFLESLPLTPSGKLDRKALPAPHQRNPDFEESFVPPRTLVEEMLAGIWCDVLKLDQVGVHDNFFHLGGHSLLAMQVVSRVGQSFQVQLPLRKLFESPTVAGIAERIEDLRRKEQDPQILPIVSVSREEDLPVSFSQQRLWFLNQLEPDSPVYNIPGAHRLNGPLNIAALERSLNEIVGRHEVLRTTFSVAEGQPVQRISRSLNLALTSIDLSQLSETEREAAVKRHANEEARRPFDLERGPLIRSVLLHLGSEDHVLLLTLHHIAADGWSMGVLFQELSVLYDAFAHDKPSPLADLAIQYADYAVWQREWLEGAVLERQLSYWKAQLDNISTLQLPTDRPRPAYHSFRGSKHPLVLTKELTDGLKALSRREGVTLFMTLLAAFQTLLHRYAGQDDISVGSPIAGRTRQEVEGLIGLFINTLVLRTDFSGEPTFKEVLQRVRETALSAYTHQDVPFEKLVEDLHPQRDQSRSPLFQVMFVLQNVPMRSRDLAGVKMTSVTMESETSKFDLTLTMYDGVQELRGSLHYNTDLFDEATIARILEHYNNLLREIVANPDQRIGLLPLMNSAERALVDSWSGGSAAHPTNAVVCDSTEQQSVITPHSCLTTKRESELTLGHRIAEWARRTPEAVAVMSSGRAPLTYARLHAHIESVAAQLYAHGIRRNDRVALLLSNGPEAASAFLGVVAGGATCAPLNPGYRTKELEFYLSDLQAKALIVQSGTDSEARVVAETRGIAVIELCPQRDAEAGLFALQCGITLSSANAESARPDDVALLLHTSGTTARPKVVPLTHANLVSSASNVLAAFNLTSSDRSLNVMPLFHIHGLVASLLSSLMAGASVVCTPGFYAPEFFRWLEEFSPTWYTAVPTMHQAILARASSNAATISRCPLRFIRSCSAALSPQLMRELESAFRVPVIESYGMTETAHQIASNPLPPGRTKEGSVGRAAGTEVLIVDGAGHVLPPGEVGEVVVRGSTVTSGYENDIAANAATFLQGWFRTGDQGRLDSEGYLFLTGRFKEIINRGGEKISPREIDELLMIHPAVAQAVTFSVPNPLLGEEVAAAVVLREHAAVTARELREFAAERLADFKVPRQVVIVDAIPTGPSGKLQRINLAGKLGLSAIDQVRAEGPNIFEAPKTPVESQVGDIWAQVLRLENIGRQDNFFQLGGDSLLAAQVMARVRTSFQVEVSFIDFFERPTVAGLARSVEGAKETRRPPRRVALRQSPATNTLPLSYAQQALWFLDQLNPGNPANNRPAALLLAGSLDVLAMEKSLSEVVSRHEALRTVYRMIGDLPVQIIEAPQPVSLPVLDLSGIPFGEREIRARGVAVEEARRSFDLAHGPVLRATLLKLNDQEHVLIVIMHHIASDGWSSEVFFRELAICYNAFLTGTAPDLPSLPVQYADYTLWQRQWLQGNELEKLLSYWKQQIGQQLPRFSFPKSPCDRSTLPSRQGATQVLKLPSILAKTLKTLSKTNNVTLFMTLVAAFKTLLYRYTGQEEVMVGIPIAARTSEELEGVIGDFISILPLRSSLSGNPSFRSLLGRVRTVTLQAYAHQDLPVARLAEALRAERRIDLNAAFQVIFNLQNFPSQPVPFAGLTTVPFDFDCGIARFDLSLDIAETPDGLSCIFEHDTAVFDREMIVRLMQYFQTLLEGIVADPDQLIDSFPLQTGAVHQQAAGTGNVTGDDTPAQHSVHRLFEIQAARKPAATAVVYDGNGLSYGRLNRRANQLAYYLRARGVGPGTLVGICAERSLEMVVGVLGILKAGGAYVPLDPHYPAERLAFMLRDCAARVVLSEQRLLSILPPHNAEVVALDADWPVIARESEDNPGSVNAAGDLAYVIYTSGSTGQPKGVLVTHGGVVNHGLAVADLFDLQAQDRVSQCNSLSFDVSVEELFSSWISGAAVILCPSAKFLPDEEFARWLASEEITVVNLPTAFWHEWVSALPSHQKPISDFLRLVVVGGEKARFDVLARWQTIAAPQVRWVNTYGPTEATVTTTAYAGPFGTTAHNAIPIGRPIAGAQVYVLDGNLNPVPIGVPGELYIGGAGLARGYLNRPELTSERFIPNPFAGQPGRRLYRTGDLCRYSSDGNIEFLGRADHQVKIRGFRIEPGEIETVLGQHQAVQSSVVVVREDTPGDKRLVGYVVGRPEESFDAAEARKYLKQKLPEYMIPSALVLLDELPLTANGKVDRKALPAPDQTRRQWEGTYQAPRTPTEETLVAIWGEVLKLAKIGIHDNFFELGGHSLLATQIVSRMRRAFSIELPLRRLFESPTVAELAVIITESQAQRAREVELAEILHDVEARTEEEAQKLLAR